MTVAVPTLASTREELTVALAEARKHGRRIGFVPTMGALHEGHASLMREAALHADVVVASVFVNPMQFGPGEDLDRYPRTLPDDLELCASNGVAVVFAPAIEAMYPAGSSHEAARDGVTVHPGRLATILEGESRPGHFDGVLTVVAKLFGLVQPDVAVFGQKDYQQLTLIRAMVRDLCLPVEVVGAETVREHDGVAMSSRNRYLDPAQREAATALSRALFAAQSRAAYGVPAARWAAMSVLRSEPTIEIDYLALTSVGLDDPPDVGEGRILVAAKVGTTRLIDNLPLVLGRSPTGPAGPTAGPAKRDMASPTSEASE